MRGDMPPRTHPHQRPNDEKIVTETERGTYDNVGQREEDAGGCVVLVCAGCDAAAHKVPEERKEVRHPVVVPDVSNRIQHGIASTNQHPIRMVTKFKVEKGGHHTVPGVLLEAEK